MELQLLAAAYHSPACAFVDSEIDNEVQRKCVGRTTDEKNPRLK